MSQQYKLSPSEEEYLEAIYTKQERSARVATTGDLAACLGVRDASVTEMLKKLSEKGGRMHDRYKGQAQASAA
jgi:Mn-dependent DtxR family transcriptional regulator